MVVLDTDHMSLLDHGISPTALRLRARLASLDPAEVATTIVTYEEQTRGWLAVSAKARTVTDFLQAYRRLSTHLSNYRKINVLDFDEQSAVEFRRLLGLRLRVGTMDLRIAAIVLSQNAILLSRNAVDFMRIPGLRVEDWSS